MSLKSWYGLVVRSIALSGATLAIIALVAGYSPSIAQDEMENEFEGDPEAIAYGKERYGARCVYCHGSGGLGAKGPNLVDNKWKFGGDNDSLFYTIAAGRPGTQMGAFGTTLDGDDIWKIIAYLRAENEKWNAERAEKE